MTVTVFRDGVMASDSGAFDASGVFPWFRKVASGPDGVLWGVTGSSAVGSEVLAWVDSGYRGLMPDLGAGGDAGNETAVLVARPDGQLRILTKCGEENFDGAPYMALGGAAGPALGALFAGADAETAVRAAIEHSTMAAGKVQAIRW